MLLDTCGFWLEIGLGWVGWCVQVFFDCVGVVGLLFVSFLVLLGCWGCLGMFAGLTLLFVGYWLFDCLCLCCELVITFCLLRLLCFMLIVVI